jgi:hypothetical protein
MCSKKDVPLLPLSSYLGAKAGASGGLRCACVKANDGCVPWLRHAPGAWRHWPGLQRSEEGE